MNTKTIAGLVLGLLFGAVTAFAQDQSGHHGAADHAHFGTVNFANSCARQSQQELRSGIALLHSFGYAMARRAFEKVAADDPQCALAHWGIAMSHYHPLWAPPTSDELRKGAAAAAEALAISTASERERAYGVAIDTFYRDAASIDHQRRALAYRDAMASLTRRFPQDREAETFYALALLGSAPPADHAFTQQRQAAEILNRLLPLEPEHPGIAHYLIHAFDYPQLAELALPAARAYADLAPASPHAQHMPSHIFTRLGMWEESIASNLDSERSANHLVARTHSGATSADALHALDYLEYAYLQIGEDGKAKAVIDRAYQASTFDDASVAAGYALAAMKGRYALERRQWPEAAKLEAPRARLPWDAFPYTLAVTYFAQAIGGARSEELSVAHAALAQLVALRDRLSKAPPVAAYDWVGEIESLHLAGAGWVAHTEGKDQEAVQLLRSAANLQDRVGKWGVTPGELLPARELLGDLLLELKQPTAALREYEVNLTLTPNRLNGLYGAAMAAELAGDAHKARRFYAQIVKQCADTASLRAEVQRARSKLAN